MSTSGTYNFNPSLGELSLYAYQLIGLRPTSLLQEHFDAARTATNLIMMRWSNQGVNLWSVSNQNPAVSLVQGQGTYTVPTNTVVILDAYVTVNGIDRVILPISRTEYTSYPNKAQQGFPTTFWFNRQLSPYLTLWPVPDNSSYTLQYYSLIQLQDANLAGTETVDIPPIWLEALAYALALRLAQIWAPDKVVMMKSFSDEAYNIAASQNIETAQQYISPQISGYFR
jgi:hypothetical protein